jgi:hypothetical protein
LVFDRMQNNQRFTSIRLPVAVAVPRSAAGCRRTEFSEWRPRQLEGGITAMAHDLRADLDQDPVEMRAALLECRFDGPTAHEPSENLDRSTMSESAAIPTISPGRQSQSARLWKSFVRARSKKSETSLSA